MSEKPKIKQPGLIDNIINMFVNRKHLGKPRVEPQGSFGSLLDMLLTSENKDGLVVKQKDFYDAKYAKQGGLQGLADKRKAAGINQNIDPTVLQSMGVTPTFDKPHNPAQAVLAEDKDVLIQRQELGNTTGGYYRNKSNEIGINNQTTLNSRKEAINHEMYHSTQPIDDNTVKNYKTAATSGLDAYRNQQVEAEARTTGVLRDAMQSGLEPVYDDKTRQKFDEWLRTSAGVKSQNQHKLKPEVIKYLIDKIVENQSAKREDVA